MNKIKRAKQKRLASGLEWRFINNKAEQCGKYCVLDEFSVTAEMEEWLEKSKARRLERIKALEQQNDRT